MNMISACITLLGLLGALLGLGAGTVKNLTYSGSSFMSWRVEALMCTMGI